MRTRRPHPQGSSYAGETPAPPGCLLCERDARTSQGSSYAGETPAHPGFLLCERDARTSQGASYADETPAHPGSAGTRSVPEHRDAEDAETITICIHPFNA